MDFDTTGIHTFGNSELFGEEATDRGFKGDHYVLLGLLFSLSLLLL